MPSSVIATVTQHDGIWSTGYVRGRRASSADNAQDAVMLLADKLVKDGMVTPSYRLELLTRRPWDVMKGIEARFRIASV